jgi:hypothetical protein
MKKANSNSNAPTPEEMAVLRKLAQKVGAMGGHKAAANMTKAQRVARAKKAAAARYAKQNKGGAQ